jgi:uroporphyrinogen decarboxylase
MLSSQSARAQPRCAARRSLRVRCAAGEAILLRAARGEAVERPPVWLMRQAGRYMAEFRACVSPTDSAASLLTRPVPSFSDKYPFRMRSETPEIALELSLQARPVPCRRRRRAIRRAHAHRSLQPWRAFKPDGVIMFSDILTPLPALGCALRAASPA